MVVFLAVFGLTIFVFLAWVVALDIRDWFRDGPDRSDWG